MKRVAGLDIGSFAIKAVEIEYEVGRVPRVSNFGMVTLPRGAVVGGDILDGGKVADAIKRLWSQGNFKAKEVSVGVSGSRVFLRDIEMPEMPDSDILSSIRIEASQFLPGDLGEYEVDFESALGGASQSVDGFHGVHLVASDASLLRQFEAVVLDAGLKLVSLDSSFFSLFRAVARLEQLSSGTHVVEVKKGKDASHEDASAEPLAVHPTLEREESSGTELNSELSPEPAMADDNSASLTESITIAQDDVLAIVIVGADKVSIGVSENGMVTLARSLEHRGGDVITTAIAETFHIDENRAETIKRQLGSFIEPDSEIAREIDLRSLEELVRSKSSEIAESISSTLTSYLFQKENTASVRVLIGGGGALTFGLFEALRQSLSPEIVIEKLDLLERVNFDVPTLSTAERDRIAAVMQEALAIAVGRWIAGSGTRVINLLGTEAADRRRFMNDVAVAGLGIVLVVGVLGGVDVIRSNQLSNVNRQIGSAQSQLAMSQAKLARLNNVAAVKTQLSNQEKQVQSVLANDVTWPILVSSLDNATPSDVWWTSFSGVAAQGTQPASVTFGAMGCTQQAAADWINGISLVSGILDPWVSSSTASGSAVCANSPATSQPNNTVITFNSTASLGNSITPSRFQSYLTGEGISQ